jgi:hypothetical protein
MEGEERMRAGKLKNYPDGYFLKDSYDNWYTCGICGKSIKSKETWWDLNGKLCADCQRNIKEGVITVSLLKNRDEWFSAKTIYSQFGIRSNTATKMIQNNELIGRELTDINGRIYLTVFIKDENESFLKAHPQKKFEMDTIFVDSDGKQFKL